MKIEKQYIRYPRPSDQPPPLALVRPFIREIENNRKVCPTTTNFTKN